MKLHKIGTIILATGLAVLGVGGVVHATDYYPYGYTGGYDYTYNYNQYYSGYTQPYNYYSYTNYSPYPYTTVQGVSLSQTSLYLTAGQATSVTVYGTSPLSVSSSNPAIVWQSLTGNTLTVQALAPGQATLSVCSGIGAYYYSGNCASLVVTVTGGYYGTPGYNYPDPYYPYPPYHGGQPLLNVSTVRIDEEERERIRINIPYHYGYHNAYISKNSNDRIASANIDDDELVIRGLRDGTTYITVCYSGNCSTVRVEVED